jgi:hypothetical protein
MKKERRDVIKKEMEKLLKQFAFKLHNNETSEAECKAEGKNPFKNAVYLILLLYCFLTFD